MSFFHILLALDTNSAAEKTGQWVGEGLVICFMIAGLCKCVEVLRRPATSSLCVLSLALLLAAWIPNAVWGLLVRHGHIPENLHWGIFVLTLPLTVAVLVLAIVGLSLYDRERFNQGRKQAVWALILGTFTLLGTAGSILSEPLRQLAEKIGEQARQVQVADEARMEKWNFAIRPPHGGWQSRSPAGLMNDACLAYAWPEEEMYLTVIAEESDLFSNGGLEDVVAAVKTNMAGKSEVHTQTESSVELDQLPARRIRSAVQDRQTKTEVAYDQWVLNHRGYVWQITVWGKQADQETKIKEASESVAKSFRILDKSRKTSGSDLALNQENLAQGYRVKLANQGWKSWIPGKEKSGDPPVLATFAAQSLNSGLIITPCHGLFGEEQPALDAVARAYLADLDFTYNRSDAAFATRTLDKPFPGLEITTEREIEEGMNFRYLFRIYQTGKHVWGTGGWVRKESRGTLEELRKALDTIELFVPESPAAPPATKEAAKVLARWHNQVGLWYHNRNDHEKALAYFREASRRQPDERAYFENITQSLEQQEKYGAALAIMERAKDRSFADQPVHLMRRAWLLLKAGKAKEGKEQLLALFKGGYRQNDDVLACINELLNRSENDLALEVTAAYAAAQQEPRTRLWQAQVLDRVGQPEEAVKQMEKLIQDEPDYAEASYALGELSNRQGDHEKTLALAAALEKSGQDTVRLHLMRGWSHMGRKWYKDARASFDKAAGIAPENEEVKTALQEVSASLGQGSNADIKASIEPVPLPPEIAGQLEGLQKLPESYGEGHHAAMLLWARSIHYSPTSLMRTTTRRIIRILNEEGADSFSTLEYTYDPVIERLHVNRAEVRDASGKVVAKAGLGDAYVLDTGDGAMATTDRTVHVQVPGLKPGYTLDCEVTIERLYQRKVFPITRHLFASGIPARLECLSVTGDVSSVLTQKVNDSRIKVSETKDRLVYEVTDAPLVTDEVYQQPVEKWAPYVALVGKDKSWGELGRQYLADIAGLLKPDPEVEAEARKLTEGKMDLKDKVRALAAHVQKSVRYKAIEFGVRGQIPNAPSLTLQQRYGDCKDQALLLHHLLRASGIRSHLALINSRWDVELKLPTLDAFNHAIVYVPDLKDTLFVDTTSGYLSVADCSPYGLWGMPALVLDPDGARIETIPAAPVGSGDVTSKRSFGLVAPDGLRITEELTLNGYYASGMRSGFARTEPKARFKYAQDLLNDRGNYRLEDFEFVNLTDVTQPAVLRMTYVAPDALEKRGDATKLRLPSAWEGDYLDIPFIKDRQSPLRWDLPFRLKSEVTWDDSLEMLKDAQTAMTRDHESAYGRWKMQTTAKGLSFEFSAQRGTWKAGEYDGFHALWSGARDQWRKEISVKPMTTGEGS